MATTADRLTLARELGEAVNGQPENVPGALPRLAEILAAETDAEVIAEVVVALGFASGHRDHRGVQLILDHVRVDHPDAGVRLAVARSLPSDIERDTPCREAVIEALITLTGDENSDVRDWACFGLGQMDAASPAARDALAARLADPDRGTRCEALLALAKAGDSRAATVLQQRLDCGPEDRLDEREVQAAAELADPTLHPLLVQLSQDWEGDDDEFTPVLALATSRCRPDSKAQALMVERELLARINTLLAGQGLTATTVGNYPRTALTFHSVEDSTPPIVFEAIWSDEDPWVYPLEQMAQSFVYSFEIEAEES
jgi:HEAT repeats